ncbi:tetratricopeptide repeat protein [Helicobacter cetorum]|uniref:tetratricopeptide repeat protein n=1 Tax=Helicobacter cetorum TaxID=138563 RepID=UPI000CF13A69|nr:hypothetical protein [Helicobacter cetorum]
MEHFAFLYKDSLFSIALLTFVIALVILLEQMRAYYTQKKNRHFLEKFIKAQNAPMDNQGLEELLKHAKFSSLMFLARAYFKSADVEISVRILKGLLERPLNTEEKIAVLDLLAKNYFSVGYLQKSQKALKEILRFAPRNTEALLKLMHVYELEKQYQKALETLECLEELQVPEIETTKNYLYMMYLIENQENDTKILHLATQEGLKKIALNYLKTHNIDLFWQEIDKMQYLEPLLDVLWDISYYPPLIVEKHPLLKDIARAKGLLEDNCHCQNFELEIMRSLKTAPTQAKLTFEYRCNACKQIFPFENYRCPTCYKLAFMEVVCKISKETYKEAYA